MQAFGNLGLSSQGSTGSDPTSSRRGYETLSGAAWAARREWPVLPDDYH